MYIHFNNISLFNIIGVIFSQILKSIFFGFLYIVFYIDRGRLSWPIPNIKQKPLVPMIFCGVIRFLKNIMNRCFLFLVNFLAFYWHVKTLWITCGGWIVSSLIGPCSFTLDFFYYRNSVFFFIIFKDTAKSNIIITFTLTRYDSKYPVLSRARQEGWCQLKEDWEGL